MKIKLPCELVSVVPSPFVSPSTGDKVDNYKALFICEGEVFDINFIGKERYDELKTHERKLLDYTFLLRKNKFGAFKIAFPFNG